MKDTDYKYNVEFIVEGMTYEQFSQLRTVLTSLQNTCIVKNKELKKILKTQTERTSI